MIWLILWDIHFPQHLLISPQTLALFSGLTKGKTAASPPPEWWSDGKIKSFQMPPELTALCLSITLLSVPFHPFWHFWGGLTCPAGFFKNIVTRSLQRLVLSLFDGFSGCSVSLCFCHRKHTVNWVASNPGSDCKSFKLIHFKLTALES